MSGATRHDEFLLLMERFLGRTLEADAFCSEFTALWIRDRDETCAKKATWPQPYDELLLAAFQRGEISGSEFERKSAALWGYAEDTEFQAMVDALHSACAAFSESPEAPWQIGEEELRREVGEALARCQQRDKALARVV
jgi:hypothetical protein